MFKSLSKSPTEDADLDYLIKIDELYNLFKSCFYNDPDTLEEFLNYICLINKEIGINYKNENYLGKSWYHHAIDLAGESENGVMKVIDWLTLNEFNSNLEDSEGQTSLLYCSQKIFNFQNKSSDFSNSYSQICVRMLERNSSIWFKDHRNKSALYYLILSNRCLDKVKEAVNNSGLEECREEFYHIFQNCFKLQPSKSDNSQENNTKLRNNFKVLEFLIDNNPNLRKVIFKEKFQGYSWYHFAIKLADEQNQSTLVLDVIQWLEKKGFNCQIKDSNKRTPLLYCAEKMSRSKKKNPTYSTIFIKLLAMDSEFLIKDKNGKSALQYLLLSNNYATILKDIISQLTLVDFNYGSSTLLSHCFARYCKKDFVMKAFLHKLKTLFEKSEARLSTILNETDNDGCIPLILAISNRYLEDSTKLLLLDMTGICKELFLDFCNQDFHYKHNAIYAKLIEKILANKDLKEDYLQNNVHCDSKKTPLHFLCAKCDNKHLGIIKCLVGNHSQKIDFNAKT
ncbi:uncharacterized protein [Clytia hemisphaerica]|uniref:uncharacterized protein n=1 Tax=Clytia hemisphaerica TaxID=252671 RepID=UPI0034D520DA